LHRFTCYYGQVVMGLFHESVKEWFEQSFDAPTEAQTRGWPAIKAGNHTLIAAPTGSGKTLAAFLCAINSLIEEGLRGELEPGVRVLYVSPLKALTNDVEKNLAAPLRGIEEALNAADADRRVEIETA